MKKLLVVIVLVILLEESVAPPPRRTEPKVEKERENSQTTGLEEFGIEYERYLREVIDVLESDPDFKRKLEQAEETDIRTGKIAHELSYVDHNVRSKLDEVKRAELERLRHLAQKQYELTNGIDVDHMKIMPPEHLDHGNPHTFEIEDLKKLIHKVTNDLNEADKNRREEFKEYEMQKEFENNEKLKHLEGDEKQAFEKELKDNETKHKQHDPLHHPGSKQQLEEVWEKQDHMQQEFNPKVFFQLHDIDGNGFWDQNEVKALFIKELDKMYQAGAPEDDMRERAEELERMREHVFRETDRNGDQLISYDEFLEQTKKPEFEKDPSWESIDQQPVYTQQEYAEFERRRMEEVQHMINQGLIPPQPVYHVPPGYHHPGMQQQFPQHPQQQFQQHPNQQQFQQYPNQQQQQHHVNQQYQQHPNDAHQQPPQLHHSNQQFQQQQHPNEIHQQLPQPSYSNQQYQQQQHSNEIHQQPPQLQINPQQQHPNAIHPPQQHPNEIHQPQQQTKQPFQGQHLNQVPQQPPQHFNQASQQPPQQYQQQPVKADQPIQQQANAQLPPPQNQQFQQQQPPVQPADVKNSLGDPGHAPAINLQAQHQQAYPNQQNQPPINAHPNSIGGGSHKTLEQEKPQQHG